MHKPTRFTSLDRQVFFVGGGGGLPGRETVYLQVHWSERNIEKGRCSVRKHFAVFPSGVAGGIEINRESSARTLPIVDCFLCFPGKGYR